MANTNSKKVGIPAAAGTSRPQIQQIWLKCDKCEKPMKTPTGLKMHRIACNVNMISEETEIQTDVEKNSSSEKYHVKEKSSEENPENKEVNITTSTIIIPKNSQLQIRQQVADNSGKEIQFHEKTGEITQKNNRNSDIPKQLLDALQIRKQVAYNSAKEIQFHEKTGEIAQKSNSNSDIPKQ